ncbi:homeobox protein 2-like [Rhopalosiphum maidis]|uniref:homeobox protein 2-like n=1 Tax=Rhopalosiphum maidis TaxID=43146 RepID=UPI000EFE400B|nr:homeobox protein 2-like [Rhopalosiphum maidis]
MILISYKYNIVSILVLVVAVQIDTQQILNNNELSSSLSNEQVTKYQYEKTIQTATTENNQDQSITTNINTEFVQKSYSSSELNLNNADTNDLNSAINGQGYDSNGNIPVNDNGIVNNYQWSNYFSYMQYIADQESENTEQPNQSGTSENVPVTPNGNTVGTFSSEGTGINTPMNMNGSPSPATTTNTPSGLTASNTPIPYTGPGSPNSNLNGGSLSPTTSSPETSGYPPNIPPNSANIDLTSGPYDIGTTNGLNSYFYMPITYPPTGPGNMNNDVPNYPQSTGPNTGSGASNSSPNGGTSTAPISSPNSNGSPRSPYGDLTGNTNGQGYDSNGNIPVNDNGIVNNYQWSNYFSYMQYIADQESKNTEQPNQSGTSEDVDNLKIQRLISSMNLQTTATSTGTFSNSPSNQPVMLNGNTVGTSSSEGTGINTPMNMNGSPSPVTTTNTPSGLTASNTPIPYTGPGSPNSNLNGGSLSPTTSSPETNGYPPNIPPNSANIDLTSGPYDIGTTNGLNSYFYMPITYPPTGPGNMNNGVPNYPQSTGPNTGSGASNSSPNGGTSTAPISSPNSNGSPRSPYGDLTGNTNGQGYDSNGNIPVNDNGIVNNYQSSNYYSYVQYIADQGSENTEQPNQSGTSEDVPVTPNGNTVGTSSNEDTEINTPMNMNGSPSPATTTNTPSGLTSSNTPNPYTGPGSPNSNLNGGSLSPTTSSPETNGYPPNIPPNSANIDLTSGPYDIGTTNGLNSYFYMPITYPPTGPGNMNNGVPNYPQSTGPNTGSGASNSNLNGEISNSISPPTPNTDLNPMLNGGVPFFKGYEDFYGIPQSGYQPSTGQILDNYESPNYNFDYELQNGDIDDVLNDGQINIDGRYMPDNYDQLNNGGVYTPGSNENVEFYNSYYYEKSSVNFERQNSNGGYDTPNYGSNVDDYLDNIKHDNENLPEPMYDTYASNLIPGYENNQLNNGPPSRGYSFSDNDAVPYDTDINSYNGFPISEINSDKFNYGNMPYGNDQSDIGIDDISPNNNQLSGNTYAEIDTSNVNTQIGGSTQDGSNGIPINTVDSRFNSIQNTVVSKNNALNVGQNVYGANGQVIGKIYNPSDATRKNNNRHKYSGSSSYSSHSDSVFSDDIHAIGNDIKRAARDAIGNIYNKTKDAYDITKGVGKAIGNAAGNVASDAANGVKNTADNIYQGSKDVAEDIGNAASTAADDVKQTANNAYQDTNDVMNGMGDVISEAGDGITQTANNAYQGTKDVVNGV